MIPLLIRGESDQFDLTGEELSLFQMMASGFPYLTGGEQRTEFLATQRIVFLTKQSWEQSLLGDRVVLHQKQKRDDFIVRLLCGYHHHSKNRA